VGVAHRQLGQQPQGPGAPPEQSQQAQVAAVELLARGETVEFGYPCPEVVRPDLDPEEMRTLARALNLARRTLTSEQKRALIADQLAESPARTNRMIAKLLGVDHKTVASVRAEAERLGEIPNTPTRTGRDGRTFKAAKSPKTVTLSDAERWARRRATTLVPGDCRQGLKTIGTASVDCVVIAMTRAKRTRRGKCASGSCEEAIMVFALQVAGSGRVERLRRRPQNSLPRGYRTRPRSRPALGPAGRPEPVSGIRNSNCFRPAIGWALSTH
jgi:hypothetical protein